MTCVFCSKPEIKAREIISNDLAWAFPTNIPITPGHILIAPKRCVATLQELTAEERLAILSLADQIMSALKKTFGAQGFNSVWNQGVLAGQSVPHFHLHIISRTEGDAGVLGYDPRSMLYRTGDREPTSEVELIKIVEEIKKTL
ncbi:MAG: HIT family protein [Candidatus Pacebacteria bacterium]|nr:HIT family protein [Candidatus Paceibacterota bacterium]